MYEQELENFINFYSEDDWSVDYVIEYLYYMFNVEGYKELNGTESISSFFEHEIVLKHRYDFIRAIKKYYHYLEKTDRISTLSLLSIYEDLNDYK